MEHWDLIVVGAGAAGLTAGIYGTRSGLRTLILENNISGGLTLEAPLIENYPGFPECISGMDLMERMVEHAKKTGAQIHEFEEVVELDLKSDRNMVKTDKAVYTASAVILALGSHHRTLGVPGEEELRGRGVSCCTLCDGPLFRGKRVLVVGGGNSAVISAIYISNLTPDVKIAHLRDLSRAEGTLVKDLRERGVKILWNTEVKEIRGDIKVRSVVLLDNKTGETREMEVDGVFVQIVEAPNSRVAKEAGVEVDRRDYIIVDDRQRTNIDGVYAAGDVTTCPVKQIGTAVGQATIAAIEAFGYIKRALLLTIRLNRGQYKET